MKVDHLKKAWDKAPKCVKKEKMGSEKKSANEANEFFGATLLYTFVHVHG